jgi:hypothetical protein
MGAPNFPNGCYDQVKTTTRRFMLENQSVTPVMASKTSHFQSQTPVQQLCRCLKAPVFRPKNSAAKPARQQPPTEPVFP